MYLLQLRCINTINPINPIINHLGVPTITQSSVNAPSMIGCLDYSGVRSDSIGTRPDQSNRSRFPGLREPREDRSTKPGLDCSLTFKRYRRPERFMTNPRASFATHSLMRERSAHRAASIERTTRRCRTIAPRAPIAHPGVRSVVQLHGLLSARLEMRWNKCTGMKGIRISDFQSRTPQNGWSQNIVYVSMRLSKGRNSIWQNHANRFRF